MAIAVPELLNTTFRTTKVADDFCRKLTTRMGWKHRYVAARLAIARSLALTTDPPDLTDSESDDMATPLRGQQLFGDGVDSAAWLALIAQRNGTPNLSKKILQTLVILHWKRGSELLKDDWNQCGGEMRNFVARLAELASFSSDGPSLSSEDEPISITKIEGLISLCVGETAQDVHTEERVIFEMNAPGGSPHLSIMGGVGSGKTRTAVHMLNELRTFGKVPLLAFDFKGDLAERLGDTFHANIIKPPEQALPLDVLFISAIDDTSIKTAAARIRDSISSIKGRKLSGIQSEALREAIVSTLRLGKRGKKINLLTVAEALDSEYQDRNRNPDELTSSIRELTQFSLFEPKQKPANFFSESWIIQLPQDSSSEMRRLIINLTLDSLDRWINSLPDAPTGSSGVRALRHVTMLDEAHVILSTKLPALGNLVRMSRSKGGSVMLVSQSPDDFESAEDGYLDNMGMTLAFNTQARPGPTRRIFGDRYSLTGLQVGEAICRIRSEAKTRKIVSWKV